MASARRIVVVTAKQLRGILPWSRSRRIDLSTAARRINQSRGILARFSTNTHHHDDDDDDYFRKTGCTDVVDLLSSPERDYLVRNDGQKVPVSSLKGKLIGLYLCEDKPSPPPNLRVIKKVYKEAKSRGHDFEIVQITFEGKRFGARPIGLQFRDDITWLILPSMDPSFKKIERIFQCVDEKDRYWDGDSLVLIHPPHAEADDTSGGGVLFEFAGTQILKHWGIEGYPFTRRSLYKAEYELQKRQVTLQFLFPPGESLLLRPRPAGGGFDLVDAVSQLSGKKVLVLFAKRAFGVNFVSMLKSEYLAQLEDNVAEERKFEVVYISTNRIDPSFDASTKDMPWMIQPFPSPAYWDRLYKVFKPCPMGLAAAVAFNEQGELVAKEDCLGGKKEGDHLQFPFIEGLERRICVEVEEMCNSRS